MTVYLPLAVCTPRADMQQEKKDTEDCERLHVCPREKRLSLAEADSGYCESCLLLSGAPARQNNTQLLTQSTLDFPYFQSLLQEGE